MQTLVTEGRVKDIAFSKRHTTDQMANLLATNIPTLAGVNPTSMTILKSTNRGSEMIRVFRGLTNGYNIHNAFRQRSKKVYIDSGVTTIVTTSASTSASASTTTASSTSAPASTLTAAVTAAVTAAATAAVTAAVTASTVTASTLTSAAVTCTSPSSSSTLTPAVTARASSSSGPPTAPLPSGSGVRGQVNLSLGQQRNTPDLQVVSVRSVNQLPDQTPTCIKDLLKKTHDIISSRGTTQELSENIQSGGEVTCKESMEGAEVFAMQVPLQQIQLLRLLLERSMMITPCPFEFDQVISQSHQDLTPIVIILFDESDESVSVIRKLNEHQELVSILDSCLVLVAHTRSPCVQQILQHVGEDTAQSLTGTHILVLQKVGLTKRQIVAAWLSGDEIKPEDVIEHIEVNLQNVKAISLQRQALEDTRSLRHEQDAAMKASETADAAKKVITSSVAASPVTAAPITAAAPAAASAIATVEPAATPAVATVAAAVGYTHGSEGDSPYFPPTTEHHISVKLIKPTGSMIKLTVAETSCVGTVLTAQERDAGTKVRVYSGENVSIVVPPSTLFKDIVGQDKQVLLRLEDV